ncbi:MAG: putative ABC transport system permease protein [Cellvibrionaceae bacterium]|jgi:putative ABC transport system permease protein
MDFSKAKPEVAGPSMTKTPPLQHVKRRPASARFLRWRKVLRDLAFDRMRTLLVMVSIGIGVTVFGMIMITTLVISEQSTRSYQAINPASAILTIGGGFDDALVDSIAHMPEVALAAGRRAAVVRIKKSDGDWANLNLLILSNLDEMGTSPIDIVETKAGVWPPPPRELALERNSQLFTGLVLGDWAIIEAPNGRLLTMPISGLAFDPSRPPSQVAGVSFAFVDPETFEWLGFPTSYNQLRIIPAEGRSDVAHIQAVADTVASKVERAGLTVRDTEIPEPGVHPLGFLLDTIYVILRVVAVLALILSMFLIVNTLTAMLTQQGRQIAVMKAIGGTNRTIMGVYLRMVLLLGLGGLLFAIPLAILIGNLFSRFIGEQINIDIVDVQAPFAGLLMIVAAGLLVPLLATLLPIRGRVAITIREALDDRGTVSSGPKRETLIRKFFGFVGNRFQQLFSRPLRLSLRNTFRRKGRLALTLFTLMLGGAVFIGVLTLRSALFATLEETIVNQGFDISVQTAGLARTERVGRIAKRTAGVKATEGWLINPAIIVMPDGRDGERIEVRAVPPDTQFYNPELLEGRWLADGETAGLVVHKSIRNDLPDLAVGDTLTLKIGGDELAWQVVGLTEDLLPPLTPAIAYVNLDYFAYLNDQVGRTNTLRVQTAEHTPEFITMVAADLEANLLEVGLQPKSVTTIQLLRDILTERFNLLTVVLTFLSAMIASVGGLGLMGTMSINVLERRREIGVMRSIGGTDRALQRIFMIEGVIIGLLSWVGASILGQPLSWALGFQIGKELLQTPLRPVIAWWAIGLWLVLVLLISVVSSYVPAKQATVISIRETLAYE